MVEVVQLSFDKMLKEAKRQAMRPDFTGLPTGLLKLTVENHAKHSLVVDEREKRLSALSGGALPAEFRRARR